MAPISLFNLNSYSINQNRVRKAMQHPDKFKEGAKKRAKMHLTRQEYFLTIMKEFKRGTLYSGSGRKVKNKNQALAIAMNKR